MSAVFDRFMVSNSIGTNRKLRRLPVAQRWTYVAGVLALASQSPIRGALLITDGEPVTAEDIAEEATVSLAVAKAALESFRRLGMLDRDEHGIEWVHDWDKLNPSPKPSDSPDATRARKRDQRARDKAARRGVTSRPGHAMSRGEVEVKKKVKPYPDPSRGEGDDISACLPERPTGNRARDKRRFDDEVQAFAAERYPGLPEPHRSQAVASALAAKEPATVASVDAYVQRWVAPIAHWVAPIAHLSQVSSEKEAAA